jgi:pyruvate ferredoxin oxidoreductase alpha subunit
MAGFCKKDERKQGIACKGGNYNQNKMKRVIECSHAIAEAVRQCKVGVIAAYPITPQTKIVEKLSEFYANHQLGNSVYMNVESEHSAISACIGAAAAGSRAFTATNSQGLLYMAEMLPIASGMRIPMVMAVTNRAISAPINIWNDHSDTMMVRDSGWIQLFAESSQEVYDTIIQAYKISEKTSIPVMVCLDGFVLSHVFETVDLIAEKEIESFLPEYDFERKLNAENPLTLGYLAYPNSYMKFREKQDDAMKSSIDVIRNVNKEFSDKFERSYGNGLIETYKIDDAKNVIVGMGSLCSTARVAIDEIREKGKKIGMIKLKSFRPFPSEDLMKILEKMKGIAVIDRAISPGANAPLYAEIKALGLKADLNNFIVGLGGRDITKEMLKNIMMKIGQRKEVEWVY